MAAVTVGGDQARVTSPEWARRYPPLLAVLAALAIVLAVLPSSLNLPQTNPTQVLEFAPVPPEDADDPPPPTGNLSSLGLASSGGLDGDGALGGDDGAGGGEPDALDGLPPPPPPGEEEVRSEFRCVEGRQTEDPLSPPCVPFFDGDNFGETYQGVTGEEIRILVYVDGAINDINGNRGSEVRPSSRYVDLVADPPEPDEHGIIRAARRWQTYFNSRYQTYGRFGHFYVYFSSSDRSPEARRADAADNFSKIEPFATISLASFDGGGDAYLDSLAKRGVLNFGSFLGQEERFFEKYPKLIWGYLPSLEIQGEMYADMVCTKYAGLPVDDSGNGGELGDGNPRRYGLLFTSDPGFDALRRLKDFVVPKLRDCGIEIASEATYPSNGFAVDNSETPQYASGNMLQFQQAGVTTILWPGGFESKQSVAAGQIGYLPEWVLLGDGTSDNEFANETQDQRVWEHATVLSNLGQAVDEEDLICTQAFRSVDAESPAADIRQFACPMYNDLRQLFTGIQVAGPTLGPTSVDSGFHAIPAVPSTDLRVPACFYLVDDYTCTKDYIIGKYDSTATDNQKNQPGCYRISTATRYLLGEAPPGNSLAGYSPDDPCLGTGTSRQLNLAPPDAPGTGL